MRLGLGESLFFSGRPAEAAPENRRALELRVEGNARLVMVGSLLRVSRLLTAELPRARSRAEAETIEALCFSQIEHDMQAMHPSREFFYGEVLAMLRPAGKSREARRIEARVRESVLDAKRWRTRLRSPAFRARLLADHGLDWLLTLTRGTPR